jgi:U3 small nucleolar RNA-associated protein 14
LDRLEKRRKKTELAEPLPHVVTEKLVREVAYKQANQDLRKWQPFVQSLNEKGKKKKIYSNLFSMNDIKVKTFKKKKKKKRTYDKSKIIF